MMIAPGLQRFVLFDPDTGDKVAIDGNYIAPSSEVEYSQLTRGVNARGGINVINHRWETTIHFADGDAFAALGSLPRGRCYQFVAIGFDQNILAYEKQSFSLAERSEFNPESEEYPYTLNMVHIGPDPDIKSCVNIIAPWRDGGSGIAIGFETSASGSFSDGVQSLGRGSDFSLLRNIALPVEGLQFGYAVTWGALHNDGNNASVLRWRDFSGSIIQTDTLEASVGRIAETVTAPQDAWTVDIMPIRVTGVTANTSDAQISEPTFRNHGDSFTTK